MDINGNYNNGIATLAVVLGRQRTTKIAFLLSFLPLFAIIYYSVTYMASQLVMVGYLLLAIVAPLLYTTIKLFNAKKYDEFRHCYKVLNVVLVTTILSLILLKYQILA
jgi:4-hydroxybenzoate polyprenyltransferase